MTIRNNNNYFTWKVDVAALVKEQVGGSSVWSEHYLTRSALLSDDKETPQTELG